MPVWRVRRLRDETAFPLIGEQTVCGREPTCEIVLPFPAVGRRHFCIHRRIGGCYLEDLHSRCGTYLKNLGLEVFSRESIGLMPLRAGDVFGHPADYLTLERTTSYRPEEWMSHSNSQSMLLSIRGTQFEDPVRLRTFQEACSAMLVGPYGNETAIERRREYADAWSAAAGLARYVVATASAPLLWKLGWDDPMRQQNNAEIWRACEDAESRVCALLRELFGDPFGSNPG